MTKSDLAKRIARKNPKVSKAEAIAIINMITDEIKDVVNAGGEVSIRGFGKFTRRQRKARAGRNPATGESVQIPAKNIPKFKPGRVFKAHINGGQCDACKRG